MMRQDRAEKVRETIEEELGSFVQFADLPATEIEAMAVRITRAIAPWLDLGGEEVRAA
ncbi:MAG TPA: hypothetical protein PKA33_09485 [Amaricoccus sp.]|uniref:hypothetical protein n=1 Tax=Amaricoccus sp. TaxID=1872485 RepID=UPI002BA1C423|nr:hypothetical protein [Amaricoccus sp.]HMQ95018.1 hypothetical protein [Amaricoccus sp.]HMR52548.1 hypothetical protein [Amaricoccus sp.]HMR59293.1 hypothetical protein [Amaricoccus sp.]HMT99582.1 hypothetical protein [Amaricoccus sp.]